MVCLFFFEGIGSVGIARQDVRWNSSTVPRFGRNFGQTRESAAEGMTPPAAVDFSHYGSGIGAFKRRAVARAQSEHAAERQRAQRLASARQKKRQWIKDVLKDFDRSRSGGLTFEELRAWLVKLDTSRENHPTDLEVKWVIQMATPEVQEFQGDWTSGKRQLTGEALRTACEHWMMYLETYDEIAAAFAKYDEDHTDTLSKDQLANVLQHLNQGEPVDEEEIDAVLAQASAVTFDSITRPGLIKAISVWLALEAESEPHQLDQKKTETATTTHPPTPPAAAAESACCVLQ